MRRDIPRCLPYASHYKRVTKSSLHSRGGKYIRVCVNTKRQGSFWTISEGFHYSCLTCWLILAYARVCCNDCAHSGAHRNSTIRPVAMIPTWICSTSHWCSWSRGQAVLHLNCRHILCLENSYKASGGQRRAALQEPLRIFTPGVVEGTWETTRCWREKEKKKKKQRRLKMGS